MMKKLNSLSILFLITALMVVLMLVTIYRSQDDTETNALLYPALMDELSGVDTLKFKSAQDEFELKKQGEDWYIPQRFNYLADFNEVKRILIDIANVHILENKTSDASKLGILGLNQPGQDDSEALQIDMMKGDEKVAGIVIGKQRELPLETGPRQFYVRRSGENHAYLVEGYLQISPVMLNWVKTEITNVERERIASVDIIQPNGDKATIINTGQKDKFGTPEDRENTIFKYAQLGYDIAGTLTHLRMEDVQPAKGFSRNGAEVVKAQFKTFDGLVVTTETSFNDGIYFTTLSAEFDPNAIKPAPQDIQETNKLKTPEQVKQEVAQLNKLLSPWVYRVSGFVGTNLMRAKSDLVVTRNQEIPMPPSYGGGFAPGM